MIPGVNVNVFSMHRPATFAFDEEDGEFAMIYNGLIHSCGIE